jgi:ketosteroid isomerase-like protein
MTNKETTQAIYDLFGKGDVPAILDLVTDDVTWTCPGPTQILPYAQFYRGKKGVAEFFVSPMPTWTFQISK